MHLDREGERHNGDLGVAVLPFERIEVAGIAEVRFRSGDVHRAVVTVDSNLEEFVVVETRGDALHIRTQSGAFSFTRFLVEVYSPTPLSGVAVSGSGRFSADERITARTFAATVSGAGRIDLTVESEALTASVSGSGRLTVAGSGGKADVRISGAGRISLTTESESLTAVVTGSGRLTVSGSGSEADVRISGAGIFDGMEFEVGDARVNISGSGNARVWARETLTATVAGSGRVIYRGTPRVSSSVTGSGRVRAE